MSLSKIEDVLVALFDTPSAMRLQLASNRPKRKRSPPRPNHPTSKTQHPVKPEATGDRPVSRRVRLPPGVAGVGGDRAGGGVRRGRYLDIDRRLARARRPVIETDRIFFARANQQPTSNIQHPLH